MVLRVAQVDEVLVLAVDVTHALRVVELRLIVSTIDEANLAISDLVLELHLLFIDDDKTVVGCVRHNDQVSVQTCLFFDTDHLARVAEVLATRDPLFSRLADLLSLSLRLDLTCLLLLRLPLNRRRVVQPLVVKVVRHGQEQVEHLAVTLTR